ncbi:glycosyltransferase [Bacteroidia bacterium]|nr:glycosyltransferase [Bacteroidia bacterium]MDB9881812.1 glycosyltransferase [Bacteroidia bacterium]MDC1395011.1 glycosyltransferase [Bacteroidia bacterium]
MSLSVVISYYKNLPNLELLLEGLENQSDKNFDVIISEDDHNSETMDFIAQQKGKHAFGISHIYQEEDLGFRKNMMLNRAITTSNANFLVFLDGDCIPDKHLVRAYRKAAQQGFIFAGRRVMLGKQFSAQLMNTKSTSKLTFGNLLLSDSTKTKEALRSPFPLAIKTNKGLLGCNWGVTKQDLLDVNGFDADYVRAGVGEDNDIEWRLLANGLQTKSMKNKAIVYHIYHPRSYSEDGVQANFRLWDQKKQLNNIKCLNGIQDLRV